MTRWRTRHRGTTGDRGAAAVEFAIVLVVLLLIIFAIIDFGRLFFAVQGAKSASREGARTAVISTNQADDVYTAIENAAGGAVALAAGTGSPTYRWQADWPGTPPLQDSGLASVIPDTATNTPCATATDSITVQVSIPFSWFTPAAIFAGTVDTVRADTTMRCE